MAEATTPEFPTEQTGTSKNLKVLSWNIYMLPYINLFSSNRERARRIVAELMYSNYQIIVFQEAFNRGCRNIIAKGLADEFPYQYGPTNPTLLPYRTNSGLWIVSKIPLRKLGDIKFSHSIGFDMIARKGAVLMEGIFENVTFQLLATHLQADNETTIREYQCTEIKEHLLNRFYRKNVPQVICGDFNIDIDDHPRYEQMLSLLDAENGELTDSVKVTYDEQNNNLARISNGRQRVIDYVLVRNTQLIDKIERKALPFKVLMGDKETNLSDHYAIEADINFSFILQPKSGSEYSFRDK